MTDTATAAAAFKNALFAAAVTMYAASDPDVQVAFGHPGITQVDDIVAFGRLRDRQDPATFGTNRGREEIISLEVMFSIFRAGGIEMEKVCSDRAYELLRKLEYLVRITDTTVAGTVRECSLVEHESDGETDPQVLAKGRLIEVLATFEAKLRVTGIQS